jgi:hypothetical protein
MDDERGNQYKSSPAPQDEPPLLTRLRTACAMWALMLPCLVLGYYAVAWASIQPFLGRFDPPLTVFTTQRNREITELLISLASLLSFWFAWKLWARDHGKVEWITLAAGVLLVAVAITFFR